MRMVFTHHVADDARAFHIGAIPDIVRFVHAEQGAAMHRLESVAHIRQGAANDYAHRVIEITLPHFVFDIDANDFFGQLSHRIVFPGFVRCVCGARRSKNRPARTVTILSQCGVFQSRNRGQKSVILP